MFYCDNWCGYYGSVLSILTIVLSTQWKCIRKNCLLEVRGRDYLFGVVTERLPSPTPGARTVYWFPDLELSKYFSQSCYFNLICSILVNDLVGWGGWVAGFPILIPMYTGFISRSCWESHIIFWVYVWLRLSVASGIVP